MKKFNKLMIVVFLICTMLIIKYNSTMMDRNEYLVGNFREYDMDKKEYVYPLGNIVGIKAETQGALVIGFEEESVEYIGGIKIGDNIIKIEEENINNSKDITRTLNQLSSEKVKITFERENKIKECEVKTKKENNKYKLGLWVRDKISGIGTLTCYNPITDEFYAIGHGICDVDTNKLLTIKDGNIYNASNISIQKDYKKIGQIKALVEYNNEIGRFCVNTNAGIKGKFSDYKEKSDFPLIEIGKKEDIKIGDAYILFESKYGDIKSYDIKIEKILNDKDSILIKVNDDELIDYTGGIIKGMSGSPILQNGKLIGAVAYVFAKDSTRGYGVFIENMLTTSNITEK